MRTFDNNSRAAKSRDRPEPDPAALRGSVVVFGSEPGPEVENGTDGPSRPAPAPVVRPKPEVRSESEATAELRADLQADPDLLLGPDLLLDSRLGVSVGSDGIAVLSIDPVYSTGQSAKPAGFRRRGLGSEGGERAVLPRQIGLVAVGFALAVVAVVVAVQGEKQVVPVSGSNAAEVVAPQGPVGTVDPSSLRASTGGVTTSSRNLVTSLVSTVPDPVPDTGEPALTATTAPTTSVSSTTTTSRPVTTTAAPTTQTTAVVGHNGYCRWA